MYIQNCDIIPYDCGTELLVAIRGECIASNKIYAIVIQQEELEKILNGYLIQDVLSHIPALEREFLISGVSPFGHEILYPSNKADKTITNIDIKDLLKQKSKWQEFEKILDYYGISKLYHFTDEENIESIKQSCGLLSAYCAKVNNVKINRFASDELSRNIDVSKGLDNYIRLSFIKEHPMLYVALKTGRIKSPYIIELSRELVYLESTMFANQNAAKTGVIIDGTIENFKTINFPLFHESSYDLNSELKNYLQAEVLIKQNIPNKFIKKIYKL